MFCGFVGFFCFKHGLTLIFIPFGWKHLHIVLQTFWNIKVTLSTISGASSLTDFKKWNHLRLVHSVKVNRKCQRFRQEPDTMNKFGVQTTKIADITERLYHALSHLCALIHSPQHNCNFYIKKTDTVRTVIQKQDKTRNDSLGWCQKTT